MFFSTRFATGFAALVALAANACSAAMARPTEQVHTPVPCVGGSLSSAADVALYSACTSVQGDLRVSASDLSDLSLLARLRSVSGTLEISNNVRLDDLGGLEQLGQVGGLVVRGNARLTSLHGLSGLTRADLVVIERNGIFNTAGISALTRVGELVVANNPNLNSLQGFRSLASAGSVTVHGNPRLCALGMLPALERVEGELSVLSNRGLSKGDVSALVGRVEGSEPSQAVAAGEPSL